MSKTENYEVSNPGNVAVELSQFMVALIIKNYAFFNEDGELVEDADEYEPIKVEGKMIGPKIEMTRQQFDGLTGKLWPVNDINDILTAGGFPEISMDESFWSPLTDREVITAWLYPQLINVVD
ncbi:hypothetical protein HAU32_10940 [Weissella confusa]|uniref:Uncharacterized protein n=1 Tax=Weissella fermenti TaxID=2987699 RepID=A0ABT6D0J0_9LACO|nr:MULTISPECIES: hypothetical protein [Weissella]MBJ7689454.1 hypothetical protein [Weissella confusa]MCW0926347.1 hypothetical protein [Weissella sp. LMG 11983]MDF9298767.1 hypothetical protein [Weissella sp. BK2]